ncbi:restriction endonuclease subunit S [Mycobacterium tuberculosis]|uniref:restriction endonuclease subunit S n=1 Tax=Mycobacterium tuberculosis TaxID=1773 RepID=UPI000930A44E|nr:restriction endonuclease subunit S [Mycobacterium tuberculosis]
MSDGWKTLRFGEVLELQRGHDLPAASRGSGTVPVIGSFGVTGMHDTAAYDGPGVAIGKSGAAIGTATFVAGPIWPLDTCLFVRDFKGNDPR